MNKIYFTSDDGIMGSTARIADVALKYNIPLSFFFIGLHVEESAENKKLFDQLKKVTGVEVCSHSYTHAYNNQYEKFYADVPGSISDIIKNQNTLGFKNKIVRLPGRNTWRISTYNRTSGDSGPTADGVRKAGYDIIGWDMMWGDPQKPEPFPTAEKFLADVRKKFVTTGPDTPKIPGHVVVLTHDQFYKSASNFSELQKGFQYFKESGEFQLGSISGYPGMSHPFFNEEIY